MDFCENQHADDLTTEAFGNFCSNVANRDASGRVSLDNLASAGGDSSTAAQRAGGEKKKGQSGRLLAEM